MTGTLRVPSPRRAVRRLLAACLDGEGSGAKASLPVSFSAGVSAIPGNARHRDEAEPVEAGCPCECCARYSRAYLAHLFHAKELLYYRLATVHNLEHYLSLARRAREVIAAGTPFPTSPW